MIKMLFECIIITGTSYSGKSEVVDELCKGDTNTGAVFGQVKIVTTDSDHSKDKHYECINDEEYKELQKKNELLIDGIYSGKKYGIKHDEYEKVKSNHKTPVLILKPISASKLLDSNRDRYMCFFIDACNDALLERWNEHSNTIADNKCKKIFTKQCENDRKQQDKAHYIINNSDFSWQSNIWKICR